MTCIQEDIGNAIQELKALYPQATVNERADMVFEHINKYGAPPHVLVTSTNGSVGREQFTR